MISSSDTDLTYNMKHSSVWIFHTDTALTITQYTRMSRKQPTTSWTNGIGAVNRTPRHSLIYPVGRTKRLFPQLSFQFSNTALNYNITESAISLNRTKD